MNTLHKFSEDPAAAERILRTNPQDWIRIRPETWRFFPGKPQDGWTELPLSGGIPVSDPENGIDFDTESGTKHPPLADGVLRADFQAETDGFALIGIACDWWFEARCNGVFCATTFPEGQNSERMDPEAHSFFIPVRKGTNRLSIRVRRGTASWTFFCRNTKTVPPIAMLRERPWLLWPSAGRITVCFRTFGKIGAGVKLHPADGGDDVLVWDSRCGKILRREFHRIPLSGLKPGTTYQCSVILLDPENPGEQKPPLNGEVFPLAVPDRASHEYSFFFTADLQFPKEKNTGILDGLLRSADAATCDFIVFGGDIGSDFSSARMIEEMIPLLPPYKPLVNVRGNHELRGEEADEYPDFFATPEDRTYGTFRIGDTAFLVLDTWEDKPAESPDAAYVKYNLDFDFWKEETEYLYRAVRQEEWTNAGRHIVLSHGAPYSHRDACGYIPFLLQLMTDPLFGGKNPAHRINLWFAGHIHRVLRSIPGTDEIAAMCPPDPPFKDGTDSVYPVLTVSGPGREPEYHATAFRVDASEDSFRVRSFAPDGTCLEDLVYRNDGSCLERKSLPHYAVPAIPDPKEALRTGADFLLDIDPATNIHSIERYESWLKTFLSSSRETR